MTELGNICLTITSRRKLTAQREKTERRMASLPWFRLRQRSELLREIASLSAKIRERESRITDEKVLALAESIGYNLWEKATAHVIPQKNPYGPLALENIDAILDSALEQAESYVEYVRMTAFPISDLPEVKAALTRDLIESGARRVIAKRLRAAASTDLIHEYEVDYKGQQVLLVQHRASGLRATFTLDQQGFGSVASKPYSIRSIDPDNPGEHHNWEAYVGLGIGRLIYLEAQRLEPNTRWPGSLLSDYSAPLRRKLHAVDPYIWGGHCDWCNANLEQQGIYSWRSTEKEFFNDHP